MNRRHFLNSMALLPAMIRPGLPSLLHSLGEIAPQLPPGGRIQPSVFKMTLNGMELSIDEQNGSLLGLSYSPVGRLLQAAPETASMLDLGYPTEQFVAMRLASRFSGARLAKETNGVTVIWDRLNSSRNNLPLPKGRVRSEVKIYAAPDGRSIVMSCRIENQSTAPIAQVLFPDLSGLRPFDDKDRMQLRFALGVVSPFAQPVRPPDRAPFYAVSMWKEYAPEAGYHLNALRWIDYGSLRGGLSMFQRCWGTEPRPSILTRRNESDPDDLRLAWGHREEIAPGTTWESGEFWLTPHQSGWAKGIEVYHDYVREVNPARELPTIVKEGVGFQTIWMIQPTEPDPAKAAFKFKDLPRVARDAREHGIHELVLWNWATYGDLMPQIRHELGTLDELLDGIRRARELGVTVVPFSNLIELNDRYASRYGVKPGSASSWVYHPEMIPGLYPLSRASGQFQVPTDNAAWLRDVFDGFKEWIDQGITSFCWDEFEDQGNSALVKMIGEMRSLARTKDPQSIFAGEPYLGSLERDNAVLDHTWNWLDYVDASPILNVLRSPRFNCNVESSARVVKMAFCDGLYINAIPKKPNLPNDTALISEQPELSASLKEVAALRKQFLPYFVEGTFIGDSVLSEPVARFVPNPEYSTDWVGGGITELGTFRFPPIFVRGHKLNSRLLIIVLNNSENAQEVTFKTDFALWLPRKETYQVKSYDSRGTLLQTTRSEGSQWVGQTRMMQFLELVLFEIQAESQQ